MPPSIETTIQIHLWNQQEIDLLKKLNTDAIYALREGFDGWGRILPLPPEPVLIIDKELFLINKKLHDIETSVDDLTFKIKGTESLLQQLTLLGSMPSISLSDQLKRATRDGSLGYIPINYDAWKSKLRQQIQQTLKSYLGDAIMVLQSGAKRLQSELETNVVDVEKKEKLDKILSKTTEYRERLNVFEQQHNSNP